MEKIYYNKLCRDKVPEIIIGKGFECDVREVDHEEYQREIVRKVYEEASGVSNHSGRSSLLKELADLLITIDAVKKSIALLMQNSMVQLKSIEEKGGYEERLYLSWSSDTDYSSHDQGRGV